MGYCTSIYISSRGHLENDLQNGTKDFKIGLSSPMLLSSNFSQNSKSAQSWDFTWNDNSLAQTLLSSVCLSIHVDFGIVAP